MCLFSAEHWILDLIKFLSSVFLFTGPPVNVEMRNKDFFDLMWLNYCLGAKHSSVAPGEKGTPFLLFIGELSVETRSHGACVTNKPASVNELMPSQGQMPSTCKKIKKEKR